MAKKKAPPPAAAAAALVVEVPPAVFTPAEAKKLAKLLKASDRGKRLEAIHTVSKNHGYITKGGCLPPLLESAVAKKKMEEVVKAAAQVIFDYFVGPDGADPTRANDATMAAMQEAKKKPAKYKLAEVLGNLVLNPDGGNSWNAVRSLRSMAATVESLPKDSPQAAALGAVLIRPGQPTERLCNYFVSQSNKRAKKEGPEETGGAGIDNISPWNVERLYIVDTIGVMCGVSNDAVQTVVSSGAVPCLLGVLRSITESDSTDMPLLTSTLTVLTAVAKSGGEAATAAAAATTSTPREGDVARDDGDSSRVGASELAALANGGAWGAVHDTLKGPCMARVAELQQPEAASGKKGEAPAVVPDFAPCLDNMARCAEILRVMAMTGWGLNEEGALEAGVAAMSSILGMQGLPRDQAPVANLMTGILKAMGSIACLSENHRVKVCSAGAAPKVLALMAPTRVLASTGASAVAGASLPLDTAHGRLTRKTAEKCLHHLIVSRVTWMADDRTLCDTSVPPETETDVTNREAGSDTPTEKLGQTSSSASSNNGDRNNREVDVPSPARGPAYLSVESVLAAANAESIDVRRRAIRLLSRLVSSRRCAMALGVSVVPSLGRLIAWWLRTKDNPDAHRTPGACEPTPPQSAKSASGGKAGVARGGKTAAAAAAAKDEPADEIAAAAALLDAKLLEELDRTTVLRDEALAYALIVMLEVVKNGRDERAAIGEGANVALLVSVVERLPCTAEEFYAESIERSSTAAAGNASGEALASTAVSAASTNLPATGAKSPTETNVGKGASVAGPNHTPSHCANNDFSELEENLATDGRPRSRPGTALDLSSTLRRESTINLRRLHCWRGEKSRDPEVALFSPLDWGWDFHMGVSQQPIQPGLILRAATLRVLLSVVAGYDPTVEAAATGGSTASVPSKASKGGATRAAGGGASVELAASSDAVGARSVLKHVLPVCLDLLSVDVSRANGDGDATDEGLAGGGSSSSGSQKKINNTLNSTQDGTAAASKEHGQQEGGGDVAARRPAKLTVNMVSGLPVPPCEELVHEEIRLVCLRLVGSLLRLGGIAREALVSVADTHRNIWRTTLEEDRNCIALNTTTTTKPNKPATTPSVGGTNGGGCSGEGQRWVTPKTFCSWDLRGEGDFRPLRASLPYVRTVSAFLLPLRNPDAPVTHIMAALIALRHLCMESQHEVGGTQPEPLPADCDSFQPLPSSREGTTGVLVDTIAGVAVSMGALVPLVSIWGCAVAAAGSGELPPDIIGMVNECQALIDYLIRRGHVRESFWSSLPSLDQIAEAKAAAAEAAAPKKAERKSKGAGKGTKGGKGSSSAPAPEPEVEVKPVVPPPPPSPAGRPDPNLGPDQTCWRHLLNARADEQRTQTYGTTALLMATITGLETAVSSLLLAGADPNVRGYDGQSPLMCALGQGMDEAARGLVEAGADVDAVNLQGSSVLKCAFLCPPRQVMQSIVHQRSKPKRETLAVDSCAGELEKGPASSRRGSARPAADGSLTGEGNSSERPRARTRRGSLNISRSRSRSRSGSLTKPTRRSSFGRATSFDQNSLAVTGVAPGSTHRRRLTRSSSASAMNSARAALRDFGRRESALPLKTPRGTTVVQGDSRMVPYILECGADPNVSSGTGDFPLHWAVIGTELTVRVMNQNVRIIAAGGVANGAAANGGKSGNQTETEAGVDSSNVNRGVSSVGDREVGQEDDLTLLKVLIGAGSTLDVCNRNGMTALHTAVIAGRGVLAGALLDAGASPNISDSLGCLPLHYACLRAFRGYVDLARRLLALGMGRPLDKGVHRDLRKGKTRREKLLLDVANIMHNGLREATAPSSITHHRATCSELLNFVSVEGFTPLHYVCDGRVSGRHAAAAVLALWQRRTSAPTVPLLQSCGSHNVVENADEGGTGGGSNDCERASDDHGVDRIDLLRWLLSEPELDHKVRVPRGATTLHLAAQMSGSQGSELVRLLVQAGGVNLDALDAPAAFSSGFHSITQVGSTDSDSSSGDGREADHLFSALHLALQAGSWETANILLSAGASVRPEGAYPSCIHVACRAGAPVSLVEQLLERGRWWSSTPRRASLPTGAQHDEDINNVVWSVGSGAYAATPLFLAAATGSAEVVVLLLATCGICIPPIVGTNGEVARPAAGGSDGSASAYDSENIWSMKHSPSNDRSPLHAAAVGGHTATARVLVDAELAFATGGSVSSWLNTLDATGRTPLDLAVSKGKWECAQLLASADTFDVKLAAEGAASSALLTAERDNMAIVDEGSGEASALSDLHESNKLIMTLLTRLSDAVTKDLSAAAAAAETSGTISATGREKEVVGAVDSDTLTPSHDRVGLVVCVNSTDGDTVSATTIVQSDEGNGSGNQQSTSIDPVLESVPKIQHLHSCFAEGVLYSDAKGVFVPDTPGRKEWRSSQPIMQPVGESGGLVVDEVDEDHHRAAVIRESRARQTEANRVVAANEPSSRETTEHPSAPGTAVGEPGGATVSGAMDQEKVSVVIQSQARQANARSEVKRRLDQQREKTSGEVGAVVVTRIQTTQPAMPAARGGG